MKKLKAAIILDEKKIKNWEKAALEDALDIIDIKLILSCKNTKVKKSIFKNFLYYVLNILALKNKYTRSSILKIPGAKVIDFYCSYVGAWQAIPEEVSEELLSNNMDVVIKFGMSLLIIDENLTKIPVLSYHHGDPSKYRGRPAGFYEVLYNEDKSGLMVQRLTNQLDAGEVLAFAESKLVHHSYKKSAQQFYQVSEFLLRKALINLKNDRFVSIKTDGKNYRLPSNLTVFRFFLVLLRRKINYIIYGAFFEKKWNVGTVEFRPDMGSESVISLSEVDEFEIESRYSFYADPFFSVDCTKVRLEALNKKNGLGDILEIDLSDFSKTSVLLSGLHYSYPFSFLNNGLEYLLPEVASHSHQYFLNLSNSQEISEVKGLESKRIVDATLFNSDGLWYLFFGYNDSAHTVLNLWFAKSLDENFIKHPSSPVCMSPSSARMAGRILVTDEGMFRFGQDNSRGYGASITILKITNISSTFYEEKEYGKIRMSEGLGPHTLDFDRPNGVALVDYYKNEFSLFSGVRRFKALAAKV
jgi:folate-dependent phosphoribosylglycinamide formyltransferase PurN